MPDILKLKSLGEFIQKHFVPVFVGILLGGLVIGGLYERFLMPSIRSASAATPSDTAKPSGTTQFLVDTFTANRTSSNLMVELALAIFERSEDGTAGSYYVMADLCNLIDQPTMLLDVEAGGDLSLLRRFIASISRHQKSYESMQFRRAQDPGFYRHYVLATAFHKVSAGLDAKSRDGQSAREWALLYYARFLGNVNPQRLREDRYSATVTEAVNQARVRAAALGLELLRSDSNLQRRFDQAIRGNRFSEVLTIQRLLSDILGKPLLSDDSLWL